MTALAQRLFADLLATGVGSARRDPKTRFQEWAHAEHGATPRYVAVADSGVENDETRFSVEVRLLGDVWGQGTRAHQARRRAGRGGRRAPRIVELAE